jgi:hypothetical protein
LGVIWRFLNVREFGNNNNLDVPSFENNDKLKAKEDQLALRYDDYFNAKAEAATLSLLPNPFNKGEAWEVRSVTAHLLLLPVQNIYPLFC